MSSTLVSVLVSLLFVLVLAAGFLVGMWRGLKRSVVSAVISLIGVVIAFFITPLITNVVVGIKIPISGKSVAIGDLALHLFNQNADLSLLINTNANLKTLVLNLPSAILNAVLFMVLTLAIEGVLYLVYKLLAGLVFKYKTGQKRKRVWGGVVGLVKTLVIALFAFMPFASLVGMMSTMTGAVAVAETKVAEAEGKEGQVDSLLAANLPPVALQLIKGFENSAWMQICSIGGMDNMMFDYYSNIDISGEKVVLRKEILNAYQTADTVYQTSQIISNGYSISQLDWKQLEKLVSEVTGGEFFKLVLADTLGEILANYQNYDFMDGIVKNNPTILQNISADLKKIKEETGSFVSYFTHDINLAFEIFRSLGESELIDDISKLENASPENIINLLTGEKHGENVKTCLEKLFEINLIQACAEPIAQLAVDAMEIDENVDCGSFTWTDEQWTAEADKMYAMLDSFGVVASNSIILEDFSIIFTDTTININEFLSNLGKLADSIITLNLFKNNAGKSVFETYIQTLNFTLPSQTVYNVDGTAAVITKYQQMFEFLAQPLTRLRDSQLLEKEFNPIVIAEALSMEGNESLLADILLPLYQIDFTSEVANGVLDLQGLTFEEKKTELEYYSTLLTSLYSQHVGETSTTYLDLIVSEEYAQLIEEINPEDTYSILEPIFKMKSAYGKSFKITLVEQIKSNYSDDIQYIPTLCMMSQMFGIDEETKARYLDHYSNLVGDNFKANGQDAYNDIDFENVFKDFADMKALKEGMLG